MTCCLSRPAELPCLLGSGAAQFRKDLAQHLVAVENCLPLLLHLALPALLGPLHPLQHRVGSSARRGQGCGQGASVLQRKETVKEIKACPARPQQVAARLGEISTERAIQGLSCPDKEPHFQSSSTPAPQLQLESLLLGTTHGKLTSPQERNCTKSKPLLEFHC